MDNIFIKELSLMMSIGIYEEEKAAPQRVLVSTWLEIENKAGASDEIGDTVSYEDIVNIIKDVSTARHFNLVDGW